MQNVALKRNKSFISSCWLESPGGKHARARAHTRVRVWKDIKSWVWEFSTDQNKAGGFLIFCISLFLVALKNTQAPVSKPLFSLSHEEKRQKGRRADWKHLPTSEPVTQSEKTAQSDSYLKIMLFMLTEHCLYIRIPSGPHVREPETPPEPHQVILLLVIFCQWSTEFARNFTFPTLCEGRSYWWAGNSMHWFQGPWSQSAVGPDPGLWWNPCGFSEPKPRAGRPQGRGQRLSHGPLIMSRNQRGWDRSFRLHPKPSHHILPSFLWSLSWKS